MHNTGNILVFLGESQNDVATDLCLGRNGVVERNGNFLTVFVLQSSCQLVVDILSAGVDLNNGHVVLAGRDFHILFGNIGSPGDGISNILDTDLSNHSVVVSSNNFVILVHSVQVFCCCIQCSVFLGCAAGEAADAQCQEQNNGKNFFHDLFSFII